MRLIILPLHHTGATIIKCRRLCQIDHFVWRPLDPLHRKRVTPVHILAIVSTPLVRSCSLRLRFAQRVLVLRQLIDLYILAHRLLVPPGVMPVLFHAHVQRCLMNGRLRLPDPHLAAHLAMLIPLGHRLPARFGPGHDAVVDAGVAGVAFLAQVSLVVVINTLLPPVAYRAVCVRRTCNAIVDRHFLNVLFPLEIAKNARLAIREVRRLSQRDVRMIPLIKPAVVYHVHVGVFVVGVDVLQPLLMVVRVLWHLPAASDLSHMRISAVDGRQLLWR